MTTFIAERKQILFVDDDEGSEELVTLTLTNHEIIAARNFDEGLRLARRRYFDLYILDNWLPDGSGIGLCHAIREFDPNTPILFYSAAGYTSDINEALCSGAQAYLVKPVTPEDLEQTIRRLTTLVSAREPAAWRAELAAIREELATRGMEFAKRLDSAKEKCLRAEKNLIRLKAEKAFLEAGGTRGDFARRWPTVFA
jgi:two-component system chemotaxis response regulator CheY